MWQQISSITNRLSLPIRIAFKDGSFSEWSTWLIFPTEGYGEIKAYGPFLLRNVSYIEVNSIQTQQMGRLLPKRKIEHSNELGDELTKAGIDFEKHEGIFQISTSKFFDC